MQDLDAPVSTRVLQIISPILVGKVVPLDDPTITCDMHSFLYLSL